MFSFIFLKSLLTCNLFDGRDLKGIQRSALPLERITSLHRKFYVPTVFVLHKICGGEGSSLYIYGFCIALLLRIVILMLSLSNSFGEGKEVCL